MKNNDSNMISVAIILQIVTMIISLVKVKLLTNVLNVDDYGIYSILIATMSFIIFAVFFGLDRYMVKETDENKRIIILKYLYKIILTISIITVFFSLLFINRIGVSIFLFIISTIILGVSQANRFYIYAKNDINKYNIIVFLMNNCWVLLLIIFYLLIRPQILSLSCLMIFMICGNLISALYSFRGIPKKIIKKRTDKRILFKGLRYSIPLLPSVYANFILRLADKYTLMFLANSVILGNYNIALSIMNIITAFVTVCVEVFKPRIIQDDNISRVKQYVTNCIILVFIICFPAILATIFYSKEIVVLFSSTEYMDASKIMFLTTFLGLIISLVTVSISMSERKGSNRLIFTVYSKGTILNIVLNIILVYYFGIYGAVIAGIISYLYILIIISKDNEIFKYIKYNDILPVIKSSIIFTFFLFIFKILKINFIIKVIILGIIYCGLLAIFNRNLILLFLKEKKNK